MPTATLSKITICLSSSSKMRTKMGPGKERRVTALLCTLLCDRIPARVKNRVVAAFASHPSALSPMPAQCHCFNRTYSMTMLECSRPEDSVSCSASSPGRLCCHRRRSAYSCFPSSQKGLLFFASFAHSITIFIFPHTFAFFPHRVPSLDPDSEQSETLFLTVSSLAWPSRSYCAALSPSRRPRTSSLPFAASRTKHRPPITAFRAPLEPELQRMPLRHSFRRRALSNGLADERASRGDLLFSLSPPTASTHPSFSAGLNRASRGGSVQASHDFHVIRDDGDDDYAPGTSTAYALEDDTVNEVYASIWRQSIFYDDHFSPPSSPSRFIFTQGGAASTRSGLAKIRHGSLRKCFTSPTSVVSSLFRWRGKRDKKSGNILGSTSFLDLSTSHDELPISSIGPRRAVSSPFMTPPRRREASGSNTTATISPLTYQSTLSSSASSSLLCTPESIPASSFAASESSLPRPGATNSSSSSSTVPQLSSSSLLIDPYSHSALEATRSFEKLRGSLAWKSGRPTASRRAHPPSTSNRNRNRAGLPPLSPPPSEQLPPIPQPPPPVSLHNGLPPSSDSLQPTFLQWERELKDLSQTLRQRPAQLRVSKAIKRSLDLDHSTPSTVTPSVLTPRVEAFEFDLDDGPSSSTATPMPRLSPVPALPSTSASTSAPPTADSSFSQAVQSFPSPPLRCRSSSGGPELVDQSSIRYYSADSDIDPVSHFSISSSSESIGRLTSVSSHQHRHIDSITSSSPGTTAQTHSLYTLACDRSNEDHY